MEIDLIFKIAAVGILVAVLNILLTRSGTNDDNSRTCCRTHRGSSEDQ